MTLLVELRSGERGAVHEIGTRARVLEVEDDRLTLLVAGGRSDDVVTCRRGFVAHKRRPLWAQSGHLAAAPSTA